jgi:glyoxylase-like metal-dependent hydrolase (beta-lactamase superfamily II)
MPSTGALLTGDTLLGARSAGVMGRLGELLRSVEMLRALTADRDAIGLPGHGPAFTDVAASATRVIGVRTRRIDQVRGYLADGDASLASLSARVYPDVTGTRAKFGESTVVSTLEYLAEIDGGIPDPLREQVSAEIAEYYVERSRRHREEAAARAASH